MVTLSLNLGRRATSGTFGISRTAPLSVAIEPVITRQQRNEFVDFPWKIYGDDAQWCPPLKTEVHAAIDAKRHPFYRHGAATQFLARRDGRVVGRILVSDDPNYNAEHNS